MGFFGRRSSEQHEDAVTDLASSAADVDRAIVVHNVCKDFDTHHGPKTVLKQISFRVGAGERLAILGRNGAGKSTLIKLLSGLIEPTSGHIHRGLFMSWPLALAGGLEGEVTGYDNLRFISRIYNKPFRELLDFVDDFAEIGGAIFEPVRYYSSGMRARLAFAVSLAIDFECLLIDEILMVGDQRFQRKCQHELFERRSHCGMILAVHSVEMIQDYCTQALVLKDGRGRVFEDIARAAATYATL